MQTPCEERAARAVACRALPPPRHRDAVEARRAAVGQAGKPRDRRRPIDVTDQRCAVDIPRRDAARPSDDVWEADAALERRLLAAAGRSCRPKLVLARLLGAVIRGEENDLVHHHFLLHHLSPPPSQAPVARRENGRVVADARLVERREEAADVHVQPVHLAEVGRHAVGEAGVVPLQHPRLAAARLRRMLHLGLVPYRTQPCVVVETPLHAGGEEVPVESLCGEPVAEPVAEPGHRSCPRPGGAGSHVVDRLAPWREHRNRPVRRHRPHIHVEGRLGDLVQPRDGEVEIAAVATVPGAIAVVDTSHAVAALEARGAWRRAVWPALLVDDVEAVRPGGDVLGGVDGGRRLADIPLSEVGRGVASGAQHLAHRRMRQPLDADIHLGGHPSREPGVAARRAG
mmetsp:Transcript_13290/g.42456  ORF Transcript_13290/g.42456 Transcript_13290/m.42456 type:complete len:400 (-) Transcript_13290:214-1413(-)